VADVYNGWVEALRGLGEDVYTYQLDQRLQVFDAAHIPVSPVGKDGHATVRKAVSREQAVIMAAEGILAGAFQAWPHVVLLISAFFIPPVYLDMFRGRGMKVILLHTESPYQDDEQLARAAHADINLVNDPANLGRYREIGTAEYVPHAYRPAVHYPAPAGALKPWDLSFVGTGFPSRVRFFEAMNLEGLQVQLAGPWMDLQEDSPLRDWTMTDDEACVDNDQTAAIYRQSKCGINFYRREGEVAHAGKGVAMGPREVELAACGTWFPRDPRPEGDEVLHMLPTFGSPAEAGDLIRWAVTHPDAREKAAAQAREAIADRTFSANATRLLKLLER
jgi:spore maturation protein CgeB